MAIGAKLHSVLKRGKTAVEAQTAQYPPPPGFEDLAFLNNVVRRAHPTPGKVETAVELRPLDILRAHGDDTHTPTFGDDLLLTYAVLGGVNGSFDNPVTLRPWPVKVSRQGAIHTIPSGITRADPYENTVITGTPVTATLSPAPSKTLMLANDGTATITAQFTAVYKSDGVTPDFAGIGSLSFPAGFVTTIQGEFVGVKLTTASGSAQAYRLWAFL